MEVSQKGQVLPLGLALLAFGMMGALVLYNTGQVATDKMRLANAADAAAFSGAQWQARALNFQAYSNRAMVANQVSIAQAVTLKSWATYGAVTTENIATVLKPVPIINVVTHGLSAGMEVVEKVISPVADAMLSVIDLVNRGLSVSQEAMFLSTFVATPDVAKAVVQQTDSRFSVNTAFSGIGLANNLNSWLDFTEQHDKQDEVAMDERASMVNRSLDGFSRKRNWKFFKSFWFYSTPLTRHRIYREGATKLTKVNTSTGIEWEWKAKDTLSLHNRIWHWRGEKRYELPIGWAEAFANTKNADQTIDPQACDAPVSVFSRRVCARQLSVNRTGEYWADIGVPSPFNLEKTRISMNGYTGLQAFRSLSQASREAEVPTLQLKLEVSMPSEQTPSSAAQSVHGEFNAPVTTLGSTLSSISVAEVYYERPDEYSRTSQELEKANSYNPYWAARLSPVSAEDRLLAVGLRLATQGGGSTPNGSITDNASLPDYVANQLPNAATSPFPETGATGQVALGQDFNQVAASFNSGSIEQIRDTVKDELEEVLRTAIRQLLTGAINDRLGTSANTPEELEQQLEDLAVERVGDYVDPEALTPYANAVTAAETLATELKDEFIRIRNEITLKFNDAYTQLSAALKTTTDALNARITTLRENLENGSHNDEGERDIRDDIRGVENSIRNAKKDFRETLADELIRIISRATDLYVMRRSEAFFLIDQWMATDEEETFVLPWLEELTDDDL